MMRYPDCPACRGAQGDPELHRLEVWSVLGRCSAAIRDATGAEQVYLYVFGSGIPHLHVMLAPHRQGDALSDWMLKGEAVETKLPNGAVLVSSAQYPPLPEDELRTAAELIHRTLAG